MHICVIGKTLGIARHFCEKQQLPMKCAVSAASCRNRSRGVGEGSATIVLKEALSGADREYLNAVLQPIKASGGLVLWL